MTTLRDILKQHADLGVKGSTSESKRFQLLATRLVPLIRESRDRKYDSRAAMKRDYASIKREIISCLPAADVKQMKKKSLDNRVGEVIANIRKALFPAEEANFQACKKSRTSYEGEEEEDAFHVDGEEHGVYPDMSEDEEEEDELHVDGEEHGHYPDMSAERVSAIKQERLDAITTALLPFKLKGWMEIGPLRDLHDATCVTVVILLPFRTI